jgi:hypothetical protein
MAMVTNEDKIQLQRDKWNFYVVHLATEKSLYIQTDWDFPGIATSFGWIPKKYRKCRHSGTDGTVDCPDCGRSASDFISEAWDYLAKNEGKIITDPGYFFD